VEYDGFTSLDRKTNLVTFRSLRMVLLSLNLSVLVRSRKIVCRLVKYSCIKTHRSDLLKQFMYKGTKSGDISEGNFTVELVEGC